MSCSSSAHHGLFPHGLWSPSSFFGNGCSALFHPHVTSIPLTHELTIFFQIHNYSEGANYVIAGNRTPNSADTFVVTPLWLLDAVSSQTIPDHTLEKYKHNAKVVGKCYILPTRAGSPPPKFPSCLATVATPLWIVDDKSRGLSGFLP